MPGVVVINVQSVDVSYADVYVESGVGFAFGLYQRVFLLSKRIFYVNNVQINCNDFNILC